jgi:hypothetical protein
MPGTGRKWPFQYWTCLVFRSSLYSHCVILPWKSDSTTNSAWYTNALAFYARKYFTSMSKEHPAENSSTFCLILCLCFADLNRQLSIALYVVVLWQVEWWWDLQQDGLGVGSREQWQALHHRNLASGLEPHCNTATTWLVEYVVSDMGLSSTNKGTVNISIPN